MKIYMIRHGETDWNRKLKIQGRSDIPLNDTGRKQAAYAAGKMSGIQVDFAYTSPLQRARETAEIILAGRGGCPLYVEPLLTEISYGIREGQSLAAIRNWPFFRLHNYFAHPERYIPPSGGETISDLKARCGAFLETYVYSPEERESVIMVFTHGAFMRAMFCLIKQLPDTCFWAEPVPGNCGVISMELKNGFFVDFSYDGSLGKGCSQNRLH